MNIQNPESVWSLMGLLDAEKWVMRVAARRTIDDLIAAQLLICLPKKDGHYSFVCFGENVLEPRTTLFGLTGPTLNSLERDHMALILDEMLAISPLRTVNQIAAVVCNTSDEVFRSVQIHHACLLPTYHHALGFLEAKEQSLANRFAKLNGSEHSRLNLVRAALNVFHDFVRQQDQQHMRLALSTEFI